MLIAFSFWKQKLQDIFTIHPGTGCHTHDLLECPCEGSGESTNLCQSESDDVEDEDDSVMTEARGFVPASQVSPEQIEKLDRAVCVCISVECKNLMTTLYGASISNRRKRSLRLWENGLTSIVLDLVHAIVSRTKFSVAFSLPPRKKKEKTRLLSPKHNHS